MLRPMKPIGVDFVAQLAKLAEPIAVGNACGSALDDTQALAALEAHRVFGRIKAAGDEPDWRAIRAASLDALADSKDLRVLAHLAAATLRSDALPDALRVILLVDTWLAQYWAEVYPRLDDDAQPVREEHQSITACDGIVVEPRIDLCPILGEPRIGQQDYAQRIGKSVTT